MSLSYYVDKVPSEYVGRVHYSQTRNGYYYGDTRIADNYDSTEEIRRKAIEHERRISLEYQKEDANRLAEEKRRLLQTQLRNNQSNNNLFEEIKTTTSDKAKSLNQSSLFAKQRELIEQRLEAAIKDVENKIAEAERRNRAALAEVEELKRRAANSNNLEEVAGINRRLHSISVTTVSLPTSELTKLSKVIDRVSTIIDTLEDCYNKLRKIDSKVSAPYLKKIEKLIDDLDPFSPSFKDVEKEVERVIKQITDELTDLSLKKEYVDETKEFHRVIDELKSVGSSFSSTNNVDHLSNYQTYRQTINEVLEDFGQIESPEILEKHNRIRETLERLDLGVKTRNSYERLISIRQELVKLKDENHLYNEKKKEFEEVLERVNKRICRVGNREPVEMSFDIHHYDEIIKELLKIENSTIEFERNKYFADKVNDMRKHYEDVGMEELVFEEVLSNSDKENETKYARLVFMDVEHPEVVTVVYIVKTNTTTEIRTKTIPVVYQIGGKKYYAKDTPELRKLITTSCQKSLEEGAEEVAISDESMEYYEFSEEASRTINQALHIIDEKRGVARQIGSTSVAVGDGKDIKTASDKERLQSMEIKR